MKYFITGTVVFILAALFEYCGVSGDSDVPQPHRLPYIFLTGLFGLVLGTVSVAGVSLGQHFLRRWHQGKVKQVGGRLHFS